MRTPVDERLRREARSFELRFTCEHCAHFESQTRRCAEGYPNQDHVDPALDARKSLLFCKSFELW